MHRNATTRVLLRTVLLFVGLWVPGATLDELTTQIAAHQGTWVELNYTGFLSLPDAVARELKLTLAGMAAVLTGAWFRREALAAAATSTLDQFSEALFQQRAWAVPLLGIPLFAALGRYGVVLTNTCNLLIGWNPVDAILWNPLASLFRNDTLGHVVAILICILLLWSPVTGWIFRLLYAINGGRPPVHGGS